MNDAHDRRVLERERRNRARWGPVKRAFYKITHIGFERGAMLVARGMIWTYMKLCEWDMKLSRSKGEKS